MTTHFDPLVGPAPAEVPLTDAPLVRVIAQVRFSPILGVQDPQRIAPFQEALRSVYPVMQPEHAQSLHASPAAISIEHEPIAWRFTDLADRWRASLTSEFVALETRTAYESRGDFVQRVQSVLQAVKQHLDPSATQRLGLRYIARVKGDALETIANLVHPSLLGVANTVLGERMHSAMSEVHLSAPEEDALVQLRYGHLAAGATTDPNAIEPIDDPSWVLDIDMSAARQSTFEVAPLVLDVERFATRLYSVFRWSVTDAFLQHHGGKP